MAVRRNARLTCAERCQLRFHESYHSVSLINISKKGLLVHFDDPLPHVRSGDTCGVYLCNDRNFCPCEFECEVVRVETSDIALKFSMMG